MTFKPDQRVRLIKLPASPFFTNAMLIGMHGTIAATNTPIDGYHAINWDTGIQADIKQDCLEVLTTR
jgi:hypothetical protein